MATNYAILGQSAPADTNNANLFSVVTAHNYVVSTVVIANTIASATTYRLFARKAGAAAGVTNAIVYDSLVPGNSTVTLTLGITLDGTAGDVLTVRTGTANALTFTAFGSDIS